MNPTHKLVLAALANFADDDLAWPRVDTLSQLTSSSRRTVFRAVDVSRRRFD
ncbi:helix-turn-helix domain-containing protein [Cutibacterium acnes]